MHSQQLCKHQRRKYRTLNYLSLLTLIIELDRFCFYSDSITVQYYSIFSNKQIHICFQNNFSYIWAIFIKKTIQQYNTIYLNYKLEERTNSKYYCYQVIKCFSLVLSLFDSVFDLGKRWLDTSFKVILLKAKECYGNIYQLSVWIRSQMEMEPIL